MPAFDDVLKQIRREFLGESPEETQPEQVAPAIASQRPSEPPQETIAPVPRATIGEVRPFTQAALQRVQKVVQPTAATSTFPTADELLAEWEEVQQRRQREMQMAPPPPESMPMRLGKAFLSGALGTAEGLGGMAEWVTGGEFGKDFADLMRQLRVKLAPTTEPTFPEQVASGIGSMVTFFIPGMGLARGASLLGKVAPWAARLLGVTGMTVTEAATEAGLAYREQLERTKDQQKANESAQWTFLLNLPLLAVTNKLGYFGEQGKLLRRALTAAGVEATQEGVQELISQTGLGDDVKVKDILTSAAVGGIIGGGFGAIAKPITKTEEAKVVQAQEPAPEQKVEPLAESIETKPEETKLPEAPELKEVTELPKEAEPETVAIEAQRPLTTATTEVTTEAHRALAEEEIKTRQAKAEEIAEAPPVAKAEPIIKRPGREIEAVPDTTPMASNVAEVTSLAMPPAERPVAEPRPILRTSPTIATALRRPLEIEPREAQPTPAPAPVEAAPIEETPPVARRPEPTRPILRTTPTPQAAAMAEEMARREAKPILPPRPVETRVAEEPIAKPLVAEEIGEEPYKLTYKDIKERIEDELYRKMEPADESSVIRATLDEIIGGYSSLEDALEDAKILQETGGIRYSAPGYEIHPETIIEAVNVAKKHLDLSPIPATHEEYLKGVKPKPAYEFGQYKPDILNQAIEAYIKTKEKGKGPKAAHTQAMEAAKKAGAPLRGGITNWDYATAVQEAIEDQQGNPELIRYVQEYIAKPRQVAEIPQIKKKEKTRFHRGDMDDALRAALETVRDNPLYVFGTAYGWRIETSPPPFNQSHFVVKPDHTITMMRHLGEGQFEQAEIPYRYEAGKVKTEKPVTVTEPEVTETVAEQQPPVVPQPEAVAEAEVKVPEEPRVPEVAKAETPESEAIIQPEALVVQNIKSQIDTIRNEINELENNVKTLQTKLKRAKSPKTSIATRNELAQTKREIDQRYNQLDVLTKSLEQAQRQALAAQGDVGQQIYLAAKNKEDAKTKLQEWVRKELSAHDYSPDIIDAGALHFADRIAANAETTTSEALKDAVSYMRLQDAYKTALNLIEQKFGKLPEGFPVFNYARQLADYVLAGKTDKADFIYTQIADALEYHNKRIGERQAEEERKRAEEAQKQAIAAREEQTKKMLEEWRKEPLTKENPSPLTPKEQLAYALNEIRKALKELLPDEKLFAKRHDKKTWAEMDPSLDPDRPPLVRIKIPGDGDFVIRNTVSALSQAEQAFEKRFPVKPPQPPELPKYPSTKPTGRRPSITEEGVYGYEPYKPHTVKAEAIAQTYEEYGVGYDEGFLLTPSLFVKTEQPKIKVSDRYTGKISKFFEENADYLAHASQATIEGVFYYAKNEPVVVLSKGDVRVAVNATYLDALMTEHPEAVPYIYNEEKPVWFRVGEETVGAISPTEMPTQAWKVYDELSPFGKAKVRPSLAEKVAGPPVDLTEDLLREIFGPKAEIYEVKNKSLFDGFQVKLPNGYKIMVERNAEIHVPLETIKATYGIERLPDGAVIMGLYRSIDTGGLIALSKFADKFTLRHEVFHAAVDMMLTEQEQRILLSKYGDWEKAARAYAKWEPAKTPDTIFHKILDFFRRFVRRIFPNAETVFERIKSAEVWERMELGPGELGADQVFGLSHLERYSLETLSEADRQALEAWKEDYIAPLKQDTTLWQMLKARDWQGAKTALKQYFQNLYDQMVDAYAPLERREQELVRQGKLSPRQIYVSHSIALMRGLPEVINADLIGDKVYHHDWEFDAKTGMKLVKGEKLVAQGSSLIHYMEQMDEVAKALGIDRGEVIHDTYNYIMLAQRHVGLEAKRGEVAGVDMVRANEVLAIMQRKYGKYFDRLLEIAGRQLPDGKSTGIRRWQKEAILDRLYQAGFLTKQRYDTILNASENEYYLHMRRVYEEVNGHVEGDLGAIGALKGFKGSERLIEDPFQAMIDLHRKTMYLYSRNMLKLSVAAMGRLGDPDIQVTPIERHIVKGLGYEAHKMTVQEVREQLKEMVKTGEITKEQYRELVKHPVARIADLIAPPDAVAFWENGERKWLRLPPDMQHAMKYMQHTEANLLLKIVKAPADMLRAGAILNPEFILRNPVRDVTQAWIMNQYGFNPLLWLRDMVAIITNNPNIKPIKAEMQAGGGLLATFAESGGTPKTLTEEQITGKASKLKYFANPLEGLKYLSAFFENLTRMSIYRQARENGASHAQAIVAARRTTLDYARIGNHPVVRILNMVIPFWNATIQGMDKLSGEIAKTLSSDPATKAQGMRVMRRLGMLTLFSMLAWGYASGDDRYKELEDWERIYFWHIPLWHKGPMLRIPKPFEAGIFFGSVPERLAEWTMGKETKGLKKTLMAGAEALVPEMIPTFMRPIIESWTNYNFFMKRPIEDIGLQNLPYQLRTKPWTSQAARWFAQNISPLFAPVVEISPIKMEHFIRNWTGGLGSNYALPVVDYLGRKFGLFEDIPRPQRELIDQMWGIRSFFTKEPTGYRAKSVNDYFDRYAAIVQADQGWKLLWKAGKTEQLKDFLKEHPEAVFAKIARKHFQDMTKIKQEREAIYNSKTMSPEDKKKYLDILDERILNIAKIGNAFMDEKVAEKIKMPAFSGAKNPESYYEYATKPVYDAYMALKPKFPQIIRMSDDERVAFIANYVAKERRGTTMPEKKSKTEPILKPILRWQ